MRYQASKGENNWTCGKKQSIVHMLETHTCPHLPVIMYIYIYIHIIEGFSFWLWDLFYIFSCYIFLQKIHLPRFFTGVADYIHPFFKTCTEAMSYFPLMSFMACGSNIELTSRKGAPRNFAKPVNWRYVDVLMMY